jgi:hypothetical protein
MMHRNINVALQYHDSVIGLFFMRGLPAKPAQGWTASGSP